MNQRNKTDSLSLRRHFTSLIVKLLIDKIYDFNKPKSGILFYCLPILKFIGNYIPYSRVEIFFILTSNDFNEVFPAFTRLFVQKTKKCIANSFDSLYANRFSMKPI